LFIISCIPPKQKYSPMFIPFIKGDCVDRIIIIRNDLIEQGYEVRLIVGKIVFLDKKSLGHAWAEYKDKNTGKWIKIYNY